MKTKEQVLTEMMDRQSQLSMGQPIPDYVTACVRIMFETVTDYLDELDQERKAKE